MIYSEKDDKALKKVHSIDKNTLSGSFKQYEDNQILDVNIRQLIPNTKYELCIILNNKAGNSSEFCETVKTKEVPDVYVNPDGSLQTTIT